MPCIITETAVQWGSTNLFSTVASCYSNSCLFCLDLKLSSVLVRFSCLNCSSILVLCCVSIQFSSVQYSSVFPVPAVCCQRTTWKLPPPVVTCPRKRREEVQKKFHRGFPIPGLISTCCQSRPNWETACCIWKSFYYYAYKGILFLMSETSSCTDL